MRDSLTALLLLAAAAGGQEPPLLSLTGRIDLPNVTGRIDHFTADVKGGRIFVAALGNRTVEVIDIGAAKVTRTLTGLPEPQGLFYDPSTNRLFAACAQDGAVRIYDAGTFQLLETVKFSGDADNIRYDARNRRILVGYGDGALGFLDPAGRKTGELGLDGHPESFQLEKTGVRAFVNVPDRKEIQVADLAANRLLAKWPVTSALKNYPMALDEAGHRLLVGCRSPARMLAVDTANGRQTASVEIVGDTDDLFYGAAAKRVYVVGGEGFVDVFDQKDPDRFTRIARLPTAAGARTGLFVPEWGKLFVAAPRRGGQVAHILVFAVQPGR